MFVHRRVRYLVPAAFAGLVVAACLFLHAEGSASASPLASATTVPVATTTLPPSATTTLPPSATTTLPDTSVTTLPAAVGSPGTDTPASPQLPQTPTGSTGQATGQGSSISVNLGGSLSKPSESITIIIALTLLAVAPSLLILMTSFTRIIIVLSLTRQALGLQNVPPNQLLAGLALFLSLFIMSPVISQVDHQAVQPYMNGKITAEQAYTAAETPMKDWMLAQVQPDDLAIFETSKPASPRDVPMAAIVPAFALSEMRTAFIIGFVVFIPFLVIDLVVSSTLMSLGMMMLPPSLVSLPFKLLLFVLVDGWALVVQSLLSSFHPG